MSASLPIASSPRHLPPSFVLMPLVADSRPNPEREASGSTPGGSSPPVSHIPSSTTSVSFTLREKIETPPQDRSTRERLVSEASQEEEGESLVSEELRDNKGDSSQQPDTEPHHVVIHIDRSRELQDSYDRIHPGEAPIGTLQLPNPHVDDLCLCVTKTLSLRPYPARLSDLNFLLDLVQGKIKEKEMEGTDDLDPEFIHLRKAEVSLLSKIRMEEGKRGKPLSPFVATNEALLDRLQALQEIITGRLQQHGPTITSGELTKWEAEEALLLQQVNRERLRTHTPAITSASMQYKVERGTTRTRIEEQISKKYGKRIGACKILMTMGFIMGGIIIMRAGFSTASTPTGVAIAAGFSLGGLLLTSCVWKLAFRAYANRLMRDA